ncbi:MAG: site-2 protease family protein [Firmicutes bacterium]|nr:site-2 protease family protein [Candidatus Fiminaster equi]
MAWWEWILSILLFIVSLGALITIHEAGHLSMAKLFKVYCHEFSIGFGPKLLKVRKKGHETYFSIRAIPLGGYVSMYGEGAEELPEFKDVPPERSLEGVKKWKKAIIVLAGVILNAVLALILILISNLCFPVNSHTVSTVISENSIAAQAGVKTNDRLNFIYPSKCLNDNGISPITYDFTTDDKIIHAGSFFIVDNSIEMIPEGSTGVLPQHYALIFMFNGDKDSSSFSECIKLIPAVNKDGVRNNKYLMANEYYSTWIDEKDSPEYYPDFTSQVYVPGEKTEFDTHLSFRGSDNLAFTKEFHMKTVADGNKYKWIDLGISFPIVKEWLPVGERFKNTFIQYGDAATAVFRGLGVLFTGGIRNMSGIVGIFETSASLLTNYTFATYLYFWGMISVNLAIFNLLPFPGLDGWQLLVTAIEGISKKKIPNKFKQTMSLIGLGLLFLLMIAIVVLDVMRIAGV